MKMTGPAIAQRPNNQFSQTHRDVTDAKYRDLRRPRKVRFFCNGDRYFKGKKLFITPHRYLTFNDLLNDLTGKLPASVHLPYGVRHIYSPVGGTRIRDIEQLGDGEAYVVAGFETFKSIRYGQNAVAPWSHEKTKLKQKNAKAKRDENAVYRSVPDFSSAKRFSLEPTSISSRPNQNDFYSDFGSSNTTTFNNKGNGYYGAFQPSKALRQSYPRGKGHPPASFGTTAGSYWNQPKNDTNNMKPRVVTVVRHGSDPLANVRILLNRRSIQPYEQMMKDISEAFGPKWRNNKVKKLFSLKGKEIKSMSEFFRGDDVFIGVGNETLTAGNVQDIVAEFCPENETSKDPVKDMSRRRRRERPRALVRTRERDLEQDGKDDVTTGSSKRDSGFGSDSSNRDDTERDEIIYQGKPSDYYKPRRKGPGHEDTLSSRLETDRQRAAEADRERARRRMKKRLEAEQRVLEEDRRKQGLLPLKPINERDPFRKLQEDKEKEKFQQRKKKEAEQRVREVEEKEKREGEERARREAEVQGETVAKGAGREEPKVTVVVKDKDRHKPRLSRSPVRPAHRSVEEGYESDINDSLFKPSPRVAKLSPLLNENKDLKDTENTAFKSKKSNLSSKKDKDSENDSHLRHKDSRKSSRKDRSNVGSSTNKLPPIELPKNKVPVAENPTPAESNKEAAESEKDKEIEKKRKNKQKSVTHSQHKSKLERQISNATHVVERYETGKLLGDGNFAVVKQCKVRGAPAGTPDYAMKVIDKSKLKGKEHMIENEIEIMRLCDHSTIVKLIDEFETREEIYLIMELVKGGDLFDAITQSVKFGERESAGMVSDLANALFYLHSRHVVHRDLKPENLLVCRNRDGTITLKLADFGLAMEVTEPIYTVCGTPTYVAPEILSEIGYGLEVDMWAVGVITYILLCGFPPFRSPDRNQTELFEFIKSGEFEYLSPYWDNISKNAMDLITRLLIVTRAKRYTAVDTLCHPWVIAAGGSAPSPANMDTYRRNLRTDLESQARANRHSFVNSRRT